MRGAIMFCLGLAALLALGASDRPLTEPRGPGESWRSWELESAISQWTSARGVVDDAIPRVAVRFDDGRDGIKPQVMSFLRLGIPVTMVINENSIGQAGFLTWDDLRDLQQKAAFHRTSITYVNHGASNFGSDAYDEIAGYQELVAEFSNATLVEELGETYRPRTFLMPGDTNVKNWGRRNQDMIAAVLDSLGYEFGITGQSSAGDSLGVIRFYPHLVTTDIYTGLQGGANFAQPGWRPGDVRDPFNIPEGATIDLGNLVVERDGNDLLPDGKATADSWLLVDKSGVGGVPADDFYRTWAYYYSKMLANNMGFMVALHDSVDTDLETPAGLTGTDAGHFSPSHVAWTLYHLELKGHIKLVTVDRWCEWVTSEYKDGIDLIANPGCLIPMFDIGDTSGIEVAMPRGLGAVGQATTSWASLRAAGGLPVTALANGTNAKYARDADADPDEIIGANVTGYMGRTGGIQLAASGNQRVSLSFGNLRPGRYRFAIATNNVADIELQEMHLAVAVRSFALEPSWEDGGNPTYADTVMTWAYVDANVTATDNEGRAAWHALPVEFTIPEGIPGDDFSGSDFMGGVGASTPGLYQDLWSTEYRWAFTIQFDAEGNNILSYPVLRYWRH